MTSKKVASKKKTAKKKSSVKNSVSAKKTTKKVAKKTAAKKSAAKKTTHKRNTSGLKPFKPGESGNPAGRPKGVLNFKTRLEYALTELAQQFVDQYNDKHKKTIANGRRKKMEVEEVDIMGDVFRQFVNKARNGDLKAIDSLFDRAYGKATQPVEVGGIEGNPLVEAEIKAAEAEIEAWERQWQELDENKNGNNTTDKGTKKKGERK